MRVTQIDNFLKISTKDALSLFANKSITKLLSIKPVNANAVFSLDVKEHQVHYATNVITCVLDTPKGFLVDIKLTETSKTVSEPYFIGIAGIDYLQVRVKIEDQYVQLDQFNSTETKKYEKWSEISEYRQSLEYSAKLSYEQDKSQIQVSQKIIEALRKAPYCKYTVSRHEFLCLDRTNPKDIICTNLVYVDHLSYGGYSSERIEKKHERVYIYWQNEKMETVVFETSGLKYSENYYQAISHRN